MGQNDCGLCGGLVEVACEPLRLVGFVGGEIVGPAEADGLVLELRADVERTGRGGNAVAGGGAAAGEGGVVERLAADGDVGRGGAFVEAGGEDAVVFEVVGGGEQSGGYVVLRVAEDGLEDLDLIGRGDGGVMRRVARGVRVIEVAGDGAVGVEMAGLEDDVAGCRR